MKVRVLFFSLLRDISGAEEIDFPISSEGFTVESLLDQLFAKYDGLKEWNDKILIAVNCEYANRSDTIKAGDEVAIMPPVQGG